MYSAVAVVDSPGCSVVFFNVTALNIGSSTLTFVSVVSPVFVTVKLYMILSPIFETLVVSVDLSRLIPGLPSGVVIALSVSFTSCDFGSVPVTVAVFSI